MYMRLWFFERETLVCGGSTFYPEESTVFAIFCDPFVDRRDKILTDDPDLAYPTILLFFPLYLDNLIEPETHTSGSSAKKNPLANTVFYIRLAL